MMKISFIKSKKYATYVEKFFVQIKKIIVTSEIILILQENLEELHIIFVIKDIKYPKKSQ